LASSRDPQYPDIRISTESSNPMVLVAQIREALRQRRAPQSEIDRFTEQALAKDDPNWRTEVCQSWVIVA
jgi:hypothetical protein